MSLLSNNYEILRQENIDESVQLKGENYRMLDRMIQYISAHDIAMFELEILKKDLIGIAKEAELEHVAFEEKIGIPEKEFCDNLLDDSMKKRHMDSIVLLIRDISLGICLWNTLIFLLLGCPRIYGLTLNVLFYAGIMVAFEQIIAKKLKGRDQYNKGKKNKVIIFIVSVILFLIWFCLPIDKLFLIRGNGWLISISCIVITSLIYFGNNYYWNRQSKKYNWK